MLYDLHDRPDLDDPVLVMYLDGWIDAGLAASAALVALLEALETRVIATFDTDVLLDHRARRPVLHIEEGLNTGLLWPELTLRAGFDRSGRDVLVLAGPEPDHQWRAFCDETVRLAEELGVTLAVGLGGFPAPVPHTRPTRLASTATNRGLADRVGFIPGSIDVPAGIQAALERRFADADIPAVTLWARVPHYVATMPYPAASAALLDGLSSLTGIVVDTAALAAAAAETRSRIDTLVANNPEHQQLVTQLEAQWDGDEPPPSAFGNLPSAEEIGAEVERFLRDEG